MAIVPIKDYKCDIRVGDTVVVRHDLQFMQYRHRNGDRLGVTHDMIRRAGMSGVVTDIEEHCYRIDDFGSWGWTDEMLEGVLALDLIDDLSECDECNICDLFSA